jgi:hypothetical protein
MQFEVVGGQRAEIGRRRGVWIQKGIYRAHALGTAWPLKLQAGVVEGAYGLVLICRLRWWETSAQRSGPGRGFGSKRTDTERVRSVPPGR